METVVTDEMVQILAKFHATDVTEVTEKLSSVVKRIIELHEANKPKPEPVAWVDMSLYPPIRFKNGSIRNDFVKLNGIGLYTSPQPQTAQLSE